MDSIVSDMLSIFASTSVDKYESSTIKSHCSANELFVICRDENNKYYLPLDLFNVQRELQK